MLPNPIEVSDIFAVDGRERSGVFFHGVETLCPRIYSVYNCVIDLIEEHVDGGNALVKVREANCRQAAIGYLLGRVVYVDANAADGEGLALTVTSRLDQNAAEFASTRDQVVGPFKANLVCKTLFSSASSTARPLTAARPENFAGLTHGRRTIESNKLPTVESHLCPRRPRPAV